MFVDRVSVTFRAGDGGDGVVSFRHEKFRHRGGPDGGDGGNGGSVVLKASRNQNTLATYRYKKLLQAQNGKPGSRRRQHGKSAQNLIVDLPVGTVVTDGSGEVLADLTADGQQVVIAKGGRGGYGNAHFVSSTRQVPRVSERGEKGEELPAVLELKMIADVGIVGLPNAGKSTLLSVASNARPEIADYPFTTLKPNLGVVDIDGKYSLLFADIPGLIDGASKGKGLGDEFLRHIERTSVLVHLVDAYSDDIVRDYKTIISELAAYKVDLSRRAQVIAITKTEGLDKKAKQALIKSLQKITPSKTPVLAISSQSGEGVRELLREVQKIAAKAQRAEQKRAKKAEPPVIELKPPDSFWHIETKKRGFVVTGTKIERFASRTKFGDEHGEQRLRDIIYKLGIMQELEKRGIEPGQKIQIGNPEIGSLEY